MADTQIHWFSIINSVVVVFFLSGIITMIIIRTLRRDIAKYNMADEDIEESIEETGWKLVHGDVFRPPINNRLFAAVIGSGIQIFCMMAITIFFAMLGMLSPASRGALLTAAIFLYEFLGVVAGYYSGRLYRTMKGKEWKVIKFIFLIDSNFLFLESSFLDLYPVPWNCLWYWVFHQPLHLGQALQRCHPLHHNAVSGCHVVWHLTPISFSWLLFWLQKAAV